MLNEFFKLAMEGDFPVLLMTGLAVFAAVVIAERTKALFFTYGINSQTFMAQIKSFIVSDQIEQAISLCAGQKQALLPKIVKSILERAERDDDSIRNTMEIACMEAVPKVTKRLGHLSMVANVATLVGLAGTINGLIKSFQAISFADAAQKQTLLAQGISISMNTTAFGLLLAIPVMIIYSVLQARQNKLLEDIEESSSKVVDLLVSRHYRAGQDSAFPSPQFENGMGNGHEPLPRPNVVPIKRAKAGS